jgi:hypothetical protein
MARRRSRLIVVTLVLCTAVSIAYGDFTVTTNPTNAGSGSMGTQMRTLVSVRNTGVDAVAATVLPTSNPDCSGLTLEDTNGMTATQWSFAAGEQRQFVIKPMMPYTTNGVRTCTWLVTPLGVPPTSFNSVFSVTSTSAETWNVQPAAFDFTVSGANETQVAYVQNYSTAPITYTNMSIDDGGLNVMSIDGGTCNGMKSCPGVTIAPGTFQTIGIKCTPPLTGQVTGTKDKDYNIIWFVEQSLSNALRLETYIEDAERDGDTDLAEFFRRAQGASRKGGEQGKELLSKRLAG